MATMNRNVNLEEVNTDAFMGIPYLSHQTIPQKVVFWGCVVGAVGWNLFSSFVLHFSSDLQMIITLAIVAVGVVFGCNFNEDISLFKYILLVLFDDKMVLRTKPMEDMDQIKVSAERIAREEELRRQMEAKASPEEQRKILTRLIIGAVVAVVFLLIVTSYIASTKTDVIHHIIEY